MHIGIAKRNYKEECTMCGCELYPNERFIVATNGEKEIKMCLLCARKTASKIPRRSEKMFYNDLSWKIISLLQEIKELNKNDNK
ncbi:hypothetical protein CJD_1352 [Clostridium perfringens D str. JGS1721]|uniref:Uncharacterized protein n=1 Tax=Clostridium perfringens D str. JGS1721 TaxID=488537 RepID=B1V2M1_CLOPF|nr:hypothetical protein [Clostridium perfringens]EDT71893.1 hypothetical protein CJD_1352 [Clostridium perfringens D str. JGS1721]